MANLIVALDYTDALDALTMANNLRGTVEYVKVGSELFTREGPKMLQTLKGMGFKTMLDLKFFDIPNTVQAAIRSASWWDIDLLTIHMLGGEKMCRAAVEQAKQAKNPPLIFGVTILTSMSQGELPVPGANVSSLVPSLAQNAVDWGVDGVVCSGHELESIKAVNKDLKCLVPGIRPAGSENNDQSRVMTPPQAVALGADYLVVGRPITLADNPLEVAKAIQQSIS